MPSKDWAYGYKFPTPVQPYPLRCYCVQIPDAEEYRVAFIDAIMSLTRWYNWARDDDQTAAEVGRYLTQVLGEQLKGDFMCCCDQTNTVLQFQIENIFNSWSALTVNTDINIYSPVTTFESTSGETDPQHNARVDALCYASGAFVDTMCEGALAILQQDDAIKNIFGVITGFIATALALFDFGTSYIIGAAIMSALAFIGSNLDTIISVPQLQNTDARHELKCAIYHAIQSLAPTQANFWSTISGLSGLTTDATAMKNLLVTLNQRAKDEKQIFQAFVKALGEGQQLGLAGLLEPCDCGECTMLLGAFDNTGITNQSLFGFPASDYIEEEGSNHYQGVYDSGHTGMLIALLVATDDTKTIKSITVAGGYYRAASGGGDNQANLYSPDYSGDILATFHLVSNGGQESWSLSWSGSLVTSQIQIIAGIAANDTPGEGIGLGGIEICYD